MIVSSTPEIQEFDPTIIPFQHQVIKYVRRDFDYSTGVLEMLLSGSIGSAKSLLVAHLVITHAAANPGSQQLVCRRVLKDLKNTFWRVMMAHYPKMEKWFNKSEMKITFPNGSIIYGASYDDGNFTRFRSYELSGAVIEEAIEGEDPELYNEIMMRIGRLPHVKENYIILITNPDSPGHWIHDKFMDNPTPNRRVFYSRTEQNPFLPSTYIKQIKASLDPKQAQRMLEGKWIEIRGDVVYYAYDRQNNYRDYEYIIDANHPIHIAWDFNTGEGKPMSVAIGQYIRDEWHWFNEFVVHGSRTLTILEEIQSSGLLDIDYLFIINGDATGAARSSKSLHSDYEVIKSFLDKYQRPSGGRVRYQMQVPRANPPIKERHNKVNAYCMNAEGKVRFFVYKSAPTLDKGMRLTALKKGGNFVEDDSKEYQHVTTAVGYAVCMNGVKQIKATTNAR
jgi:hypothetical protein